MKDGIMIGSSQQEDRGCYFLNFKTKRTGKLAEADNKDNSKSTIV